MATKTYPIGTLIKFLWEVEDTGKIGRIVGFRDSGEPVIFLPTSPNTRRELYKGAEYTWKCQWREIEPVGQQQLLFEFMYE